MFAIHAPENEQARKKYYFYTKKSVEKSGKNLVSLKLQSIVSLEITLEVVVLSRSREDNFNVIKRSVSRYWRGWT